MTDGKMTGNGMDNIEIPVSGNVPTSGSLVYKNNVLESGYLVIDGYKLIIENGQITSTLKDNNTNDSNEDNNQNTDFNTPIEGIISITQDSEEWTASKVITITTTSMNANLEYQLGTTTGTWTPITSGHQETLTENTTVYARLTNNIQISEPVKLVVDKIDSIPTLQVNSIQSCAGIHQFSIIANDPETGIDSITCEYGNDINYGKTSEYNDGKCEINYENKGTIFYKITVTNGIGLKNIIEDNVSVGYSCSGGSSD